MPEAAGGAEACSGGAGCCAACPACAVAARCMLLGVAADGADFTRMLRPEDTRSYKTIPCNGTSNGVVARGRQPPKKTKKTICTVMLVRLSCVVEIYVCQGRLPCSVTLALLSVSRADQLFAVIAAVWHGRGWCLRHVTAIMFTACIWPCSAHCELASMSCNAHLQTPHCTVSQSRLTSGNLTGALLSWQCIHRSHEAS